MISWTTQKTLGENKSKKVLLVSVTVSPEYPLFLYQTQIPFSFITQIEEKWTWRSSSLHQHKLYISQNPILFLHFFFNLAFGELCRCLQGICFLVFNISNNKAFSTSQEHIFKSKFWFIPSRLKCKIVLHALLREENKADG